MSRDRFEPQRRVLSLLESGALRNPEAGVWEWAESGGPLPRRVDLRTVRRLVRNRLASTDADWIEFRITDEGRKELKRLKERQG